MAPSTVLNRRQLTVDGTLSSMYVLIAATPLRASMRKYVLMGVHLPLDIVLYHT